MDADLKSRRNFLTSVVLGGGAALAGCTRESGSAEKPATPEGPADVTLRIGPVLVDIAKDHTISTVGYNGSVPGPLIRLHEGVPVTVDLFNETDAPELVHWHGQIISAEVDGAAEEKSLAVAPHGHLRYRLTPQPAGARFVHTHVMSMSDLSARNIHRTVRIRVHRTARTIPAGTIRKFSWQRTNGNLSTPPMEEGEEEEEKSEAQKPLRRTRSRTAGRSAISVSQSTGSALASANRYA